jgi:hypothetical protein
MSCFRRIDLCSANAGILRKPKNYSLTHGVSEKYTKIVHLRFAFCVDSNTDAPFQKPSL